MIIDEPFWSGMFVLVNGYVMAFLCLIVHGLHMLKARYDDTGRRWSRFWKGATYGMLGIAFFVAEFDVMTVYQTGYMLRVMVASLLLSEIAYHLPIFYANKARINSLLKTGESQC